MVEDMSLGYTTQPHKFIPDWKKEHKMEVLIKQNSLTLLNKHRFVETNILLYSKGLLEKGRKNLNKVALKLKIIVTRLALVNYRYNSLIFKIYDHESYICI